PRSGRSWSSGGSGSPTLQSCLSLHARRCLSGKAQAWRHRADSGIAFARAGVGVVHNAGVPARGSGRSVLTPEPEPRLAGQYGAPKSATTARSISVGARANPTGL